MIFYHKENITKVLKLNNRVFSSQRNTIKTFKLTYNFRNKSRHEKNLLNAKSYLTWKHIQLYSNEAKKSLGETLWKIWLSNTGRFTSYYGQISLARMNNLIHYEIPKKIPNFKNYFYSFLSKPQQIDKVTKPDIFPLKLQEKTSNEQSLKLTQVKTKLQQELPSSKVGTTVNTKKLPITPTIQPKEKPVKKNDGMFSTASEAVVTTFKNISSFLPSSLSATTSQFINHYCFVNLHKKFLCNFH